MHPLVSAVTVLAIGGHRVLVAFSDGESRVRDLGPLLTGPVFDAIRREAAEFERVTVDPELGVVCWPAGEAGMTGPDIDSELLRCDDLWDAAIKSVRAA